jgi:hypothetical protein
MRSPITLRLALVAALAFAMSGCGGSTPTEPTTPTTPTPTVTETFEGTVTQNGKAEFSFPVPTPGDVTFVLATVAPLSTLTLGFGGGMWDASANTCTLNLTYTSVRQGSYFIANAPVAGTYCVRVWDVGNITESLTVTVTVAVIHPTTAS